MTIKAITFDLWDTLVVDDSDEDKRRQQGLRSKRDERRFLTWQALRARGLTLEQVTLAFDVLDAAFNKIWHDQFVTWPLAERLSVLFKGLKCELPQEEFVPLVDKLACMEVDIPPDPIAGVHQALATLHDQYRLCVVSDTVFTPGRSLRQLLRNYDLERYFDAFVFSDEVGRSKPHHRMFDAAAQALGVPFAEMVHIGDRQHNDVRGAQTLGMKAVLFVAARSIDRPGNTADAVCERFSDLPGIIAGF